MNNICRSVTFLKKKEISFGIVWYLIKILPRRIVITCINLFTLHCFISIWSKLVWLPWLIVSFPSIITAALSRDQNLSGSQKDCGLAIKLGLFILFFLNIFISSPVYSGRKYKRLIFNKQIKTCLIRLINRPWSGQSNQSNRIVIID